MPELDNSKPPLFVPSKRSYNDFVLAWRGHSRKRNYSQLLEWAENPDNAPEALTQQQQTWNSRFFSDLVDSLYNGETDDAATAALAAMDAAADDGMQLWTALKREIDITLPSARSHAEDQLKTKTKQKHDETVAEFGLRFRGAVREFKNRGGEMTNYKYAELFAANVHERHQRIALELVTDLDPDDDNAIIIPDIIRRTNERASLHDRIIRANPENRRRRLALPVQGRGGGRNGGRMGGRGGRNTERFDPQRHQRRCQNANCPAPHTHDTPMCYAPGGARHDPARWRGNTDAGRGGRGGRGGYQGGRGGRGGRHPLQYTPQPQHYTPQQHQNFQQLGGAYTTHPAYPVLATDASYHGIGGTQQYLPPPPPLPSQLMQNNIARVGEAFPTMNAPPPTGQMYQTGPYRRTFAITLATNEPNCSKYIVDNASPYTLTGSLNHLYDVQQLEKPKEIGGIKKDSTIKCTHVGKIDFTTHEGTLTVSNAYYSAELAGFRHSKFQQRSNRGVFVGYSKDVPGSYVIWQPDENKTKLSAHVTCMEKLKEDGTLLHPAHIFYPELARTKVSKSACVFNIGTKIGPGGRRIAQTSVPHAPSTNLMEIGGELDTHSQKTTHSALDYAFATDVSETPGFEPRTYEEAIHSKDHERWILAIDSELNSHQLNGTWIVIDNDGTVKNLIGCKWVFKIKLNSDGSIARYKARLVAQGFSQIHGVDYSETYAPVVQYQTLRTLLAIYSARGFYFGQIDVETAYLYALVQELIYMRPPKGTNYGPNKICRLLKSLYGLKQAGRNWYLDLKDYLVELGFKPGEVDIGMYSAAVGTENEIWILVYVDDIIFASKNEQTKDIFAGHLRKKYRITEPAQLTWALGMKVSFAADGIILTQDLYVSKILERFGFTSAAKSATTPLAHGTTLTRADEEDAEARHLAQQFVGAILYAAVISRPDLSSTVRAMSHVMSKPPSNFEACKKHVLRYLSGTINRGIKYNTNSNVPLKLIGYCDASWGDNHENRRSTSGYIFFLNGGPISWARSNYHLHGFNELKRSSIIRRRTRRTKHIEIRREFIKFHIGHETVKIERVSTKDQLADIMTKPLRQDIHNYLVQMILHG
ncbi:integrase catalytic domain-containing protein [Pseudoscourfieldia marina]